MGYSLPLAHLLLRRHLLIILKMRFMVLCLVVLAVSQIDAAPQGFLGGLFGFPNVGSGNGAGFGTGSAGPGGVSSTGVAVASAQNVDLLSLLEQEQHHPILSSVSMP